MSEKETTDLLNRNVAPVPVFDDHVINTAIDASVGQTVLLPCTVRNLGDKVVSWIRSSDLHILTSDVITFSSDNRFEPVHSSSGDFWGLRIRGVTVNDTGQYECQVNTEPKMSLAFQLFVTVPGVQRLESSNSKWVSRALIKGPSEVYVRDGSPVTFTCEISPLAVATVQTAASPARGLFVLTHSPVRWLHNDIELQGGWNNATSSASIDEGNQKIISRLNISAAYKRHSGRYTCMQPSAFPDTIRLFVIEEYTEAMQRDFPFSIASHTIRQSITWKIIIIFVLHKHFFL